MHSSNVHERIPPTGVNSYEPSPAHFIKSINSTTTSCVSIKAQNPSALSGTYVIVSATGRQLTVWCDMMADGGGGSLLFTLFSNTLSLVMHWSNCHDHSRTMVLQTVLIMNLFSSLVQRTHTAFPLDTSMRHRNNRLHVLCVPELLRDIVCHTKERLRCGGFAIGHSALTGALGVLVYLGLLLLTFSNPYPA